MIRQLFLVKLLCCPEHVTFLFYFERGNDHLEVESHWHCVKSILLQYHVGGKPFAQGGCVTASA